VTTLCHRIIAWCLSEFVIDVVSVRIDFSPTYKSISISLAFRDQISGVKVKRQRCLRPSLEGIEAQLHSFLTSPLDACVLPSSGPGRVIIGAQLRFTLNGKLFGPPGLL
jgi:hypothetical protein